MAGDFTWAEDVVAGGLAGLKRLNGYYNDNFIAQHDGRHYLIRVKRDAAKDMDWRQLNENDVLTLLQKKNFPAPRLLYYSPIQNFSVHEFIEGATLSELYPKHLPLPEPFVRQIANGMMLLHSIRQGDDLVNRGGKFKSSREFYVALVSYVSDFYQKIWTEIPEVFDENDFPADPFVRFRDYGDSLSERPIVLCHADVHQHNLITDSKGDHVTMVDWELSMFGDPFYDISCHINRSYYEQKQRDVFAEQYAAAMKGDRSAEVYLKDMYVYLALEYVRSAVSDLYRMRKQHQRPAGAQDIDHKRNVRIPQQLARARAVWSGVDFKDVI